MEPETRYPWKKTVFLWLLVLLVALGFLWYLRPFQEAPEVPRSRMLPSSVSSSEPPPSSPALRIERNPKKQSGNFLVFTPVPSLSAKSKASPSPTPFIVDFMQGADPKATESARGASLDADREGSEGIECTCESGVCNPRTRECVAPAPISKEQIDAVVSAYAKNQDLDVKEVRIEDSFYGDEPVKLALVDCGSTSRTMCSVYLTIDSDGKILGEAFAH